MNKTIIDTLTKFIANKGLMNAGKPPKPCEPYYAQYIGERMVSDRVTRGDTLRISLIHTVLEGVLLETPTRDALRIELMTEGNKVWKSRRNISDVRMKDVLDYEIIARASDDFDIKKINPYHVDSNTASYQDKCWPVSDDTKKQVVNMVGGKFDGRVYLNLTISLFAPYVQELYKGDICFDMNVVSPEVTLVKKSGTQIPIGNLVVKHVFPNRDYFTACDCKKGSEGIIVAFDNFEELSDVEYVICEWHFVANDNLMKLVSASKLEFVNEKDQPIYNVSLTSAILNQYAISLHRPTVFSEALYDDHIFISSYDTVDHYVIMDNEGLVEFASRFIEDDIYNEILIQSQRVKDRHYLSQHTGVYDFKANSVDLKHLV